MLAETSSDYDKTKKLAAKFEKSEDLVRYTIGSVLNGIDKQMGRSFR